MPLIKEIEDALKLVAELPKVQQEVAAILLRNLVVFHEEETTMTKEQLEALRKVRAEEDKKKHEAFKKRMRKYL